MPAWSRYYYVSGFYSGHHPNVGYIMTMSRAPLKALRISGFCPAQRYFALGPFFVFETPLAVMWTAQTIDPDKFVDRYGSRDQILYQEFLTRIVRRNSAKDTECAGMSIQIDTISA